VSKNIEFTEKTLDYMERRVSYWLVGKNGSKVRAGTLLESLYFPYTQKIDLTFYNSVLSMHLILQ
ncbi:hypothetical protein, partial [Roseburia sp. TF10-5]|uniref:hypothetical protein n=1 Tax=Roseburia sp. TF10-5 TaxID=2293144 RepID=UPI001A9A4226